MSLSITQRQQAFTGGSATTLTVTLNSTPTPGNALVAFVSCLGNRVLTQPSVAWTVLDSQQGVPSQAGGTSSWYLVQGGDGTAWQFAVSGGADFIAAAIYEVTGQAAAPIDGHNYAINSDTTGAVTPSKLGCLALAAIAPNDGYTGSSVTAGWTLDFTGAGNGFHPLASASLNSLTVDTSTPISCTFAPTLTNDVGLTVLVDQAPSALPTSLPYHTLGRP